MLNLWDDQGNIMVPPAALKSSVGKMYEILAKQYDGTPTEANAEGFAYPNAQLLPAFVRVEVNNESVTSLHPKEKLVDVKPASAYGDNWAEELDPEEFVLCRDYFMRKEHLRKYFGFINLKIGGKNNQIIMNKDLKTGITFECSRHSLMTAVRFEIFDDILIANFANTTLHDITGLQPDFTPYVGKYGDNGRAKSEQPENIIRRTFSNQGQFFHLSRHICRKVRR